MNAPIVAKFLAKYTWEPNERAEELCLVAAMVGDAPTVTPDDLTGWRSVALAVYREHGLPGLPRHALTDRVAPLLDSYAPTLERLTTALRIVENASERRQAASKALRALGELEAALLILTRK